MSITRKLITIAALGLATSWAHAGGVNWSIGINLPPVATVISNAPMYHPRHAVPYYDPAPAVIYRPAPVYYNPPPVVVYRPVPRYVESHGYVVHHRQGHHRNRGWDRDHRHHGDFHRGGGRRDRGWNDRGD